MLALDGLGPMGGGFHSKAELLLLDGIEPRIRLLKGAGQAGDVKRPRGRDQDGRHQAPVFYGCVAGTGSSWAR